MSAVRGEARRLRMVQCRKGWHLEAEPVADRATPSEEHKALLPGVRLHDLHHTVVSLLLELGTPPHVVQAIARHPDLDVTMRIYAQTNRDTMR